MALHRPPETTLRPAILFPARWIRRLGGVLLIVGLLLPWGVIVMRTRQTVQAPSPAGQAAIPALRPAMVLLPAGAFLMGSPTTEAGRKADEAQQRVEIPRPFAIAVTEVTQAQYQQVRRTLPQAAHATATGTCQQAEDVPDVPMACVTWVEALVFCNRLSELEGLTPCYRLDGAQPTWSDTACQGYRLPTEAEWEYAARAGTAMRYAGTDTDAEVCRYANVLDQGNAAASLQGFPCSDGYATAAPVQRLQPNAWFLYDMTGNIAEWVWDAAAESRDSAAQGAQPAVADKITRGGSWQSFHTARHAARSTQAPSRRAADTGFRIVRTFQP